MGVTGPGRAGPWQPGRDLLFPTACSEAGGPPPQQVAQLQWTHIWGTAPTPRTTRREGTEEGPCIRRSRQTASHSPTGSQGPFRTWIWSRPSLMKPSCSPQSSGLRVLAMLRNLTPSPPALPLPSRASLQAFTLAGPSDFLTLLPSLCPSSGSPPRETICPNTLSSPT